MEIKTNKALCAVLGGCTAFQTICARHNRANLQERVLYVLYQIQKTGHADYMAVNDFLCKEWRVIRDILTENNVITCQDGEFHFQKDTYSINPEYSKRDCKVEIADSIVSKWSERAKQSRRVSIRKHKERMCNADSVPEGVKQWFDTFQRVRVNKDRLADVLESVEMDKETEAQQMSFISQIDNGDCYFPVLNKGRIYTPFHSLKKELRGCLDLEDEPVTEMCDVTSAFQTASASTFINMYPDFAEEGTAFIKQIDGGLYQRIADKKGVDRKWVKKIFMLLWFCSAKERKEILECDYKLENSIKNIKNTGEVVSVSLSPSPYMVGDSDENRVSGDDVTKVGDSVSFQEWCAKVGVSVSKKQRKRLCVMYGEDWTDRPAAEMIRLAGVGAAIDRTLKKHVPVFWYWIRGYRHTYRKGAYKSCLPVDLMSREGDAVFRLIMPAIEPFFDKGVLSLHDALFAAESEANRLTSDLFNYMYRDAVAFMAEKAYYLEKFAEDKGTPFFEGIKKMIQRRERTKKCEYRQMVAELVYKLKKSA